MPPLIGNGGEPGAFHGGLKSFQISANFRIISLISGTGPGGEHIKASGHAHFPAGSVDQGAIDGDSGAMERHQHGGRQDIAWVAGGVPQGLLGFHGTPRVIDF